MSHLWLIESLADLRAYAARNNMRSLAEHLDTAIQLAHLELANKAANETHRPTRDDAADPEDHRPEDEEPEEPEPEGPENNGPDNHKP